METIIQETVLSSPSQQDLASLCNAFLASAPYKKAMLDARYSREEAIEDFLISFFEEKKASFQPDERAILVLTIRKNYYRFF